VVVSIDRARALGYRPAVDLDDGLAGVWDEFRVEPADKRLEPADEAHADLVGRP
jgi:hypothetical protein